MIAPIGAATFRDALEMGATVYQSLKSVLKKQGLATGLGDEGGFAPNLPANVAALELISTAVQSAGLKLGSDIALALDVASTEFFDSGSYTFEGRALSADEMTGIYEQWINDFPIVSIEDPLAEDDWASWSALVGRLGDRVQVVGDDLFVTNVSRLQRGIAERAASALLVKVNQIGSLTETLDAVDLAHRAGFRCMNLEDSSMTLLRGHFAMTLICAGEADADQIEAALQTLENGSLDVTVREVAEEPDLPAVGSTYLVTVHGSSAESPNAAPRPSM